jgi:ribosomal protein L11 methylase PrmA
LILANLLAHTHRALGAHYGRLSAPGAHLILGGILSEERQEVVAAMAAHEFVHLETFEQEGWASLLLGRACRQAGGPPLIDTWENFT